MSFAEAVRWVRDTVKAGSKKELPFLRAEHVQLGDRKHGDNLALYEVEIFPSSRGDPRGSRTFDYAGPRRPGDPKSRGKRLAIYRIGMNLWCREPEPEIRSLGDSAQPLAHPGILNFIELVYALLETKWPYKPLGLVNLEFDGVAFTEEFPPPRAGVTVIIEEEINPVDPKADPRRDAANWGGIIAAMREGA